MAAYRRESCGAPLSLLNGDVVLICEYCGAENKISNNSEWIQQEPTYIEENILISTIPCLGNTIFEKKKFDIYRTYAELLDVKTNVVELHLDFKDVEKYSFSAMNGGIKFKMKNGQKYLVKPKNYRLVMDALNGLIKA